MRNFKIYFGPSKSKRFQQVMEAVENHPGLTTINSNNLKKLYYELTIDESDIDFLAFISKLSHGLGFNRLPKKWFEGKFKNNVYVSPGEFYEKHEDLLRVLLRHGYAEVIDQYGNLGYSEKRPPDPVRNYETIRNAIEKRDYETALMLYYKNLGNENFGPLHPELVYLKRLAETELTGRDLLYCRPKSSMDQFLAENIEAYVKAIDVELDNRRSSGKPTPTDVLIKEAPTIHGIERDIRWRVRRAVRVSPLGRVYRFKFPSLQRASAYCREGEIKTGRLFNEFPNPFLCTRRYVFKNELIERPLVTLSPSSHRKLVIDKGYEVAILEKCFFRKNKKVPFDELNSGSLKEYFAWTDNGITYTEKLIRFNGKPLYESKRKQCEYHIDIADMMFDHNPFLDICDEILRDAENRLRTQKGLPKIGEGWISETRLFNLVRELFPDARQHARPMWLSPQHLDIYIPGQELAIEYHGKQHFEAVDYFGGKRQFKDTLERDERKRLKCRKAKVKLIEWHHKIEINAMELIKVLEEYEVKVE